MFSLPVAELKQFNSAIPPCDFDLAVENHAPRIQFLAVVHHNRVGLLDRRKDHRAAQRMARCHRQVTERLQPSLHQ